MKLTKEEAQKLLNKEGEARGECLKRDWEYVLRKEGREGLEKLEQKMAQLGAPLKYQEIESMDFYPIGMDALSMLVIRELFDYEEKDIREMGASVVKFSLILRVFLKYFGSLPMMATQVGRIWGDHYTVGTLEMPDFSTEKEYAVLRLKDFKIHPIYCVIISGYCSKIAEMILRASVACKETKCAFEGDEYHEFLLTWQKK